METLNKTQLQTAHIIPVAICSLIAVVMLSLFFTQSAFALGSTTTTEFGNNKTIQRYAGDDRYDTARLINEEVATNGVYRGVIIISAETDKFADALCASGLSGLLNYPIVPVSGSAARLDDSTLATINSLTGGSRADIIILGGTSTVSKSIENQMIVYDSNGTVKRIEGADRYATSEAIYDYGLEHGGWTSEYAILTKGNDFPDALSAASYCATNAAPVLLTDANSTSLPFYVLEMAYYMSKKIVIVGGETSVSAAKESPLTWYTSVERIQGSSRYETNRAFVNWELEHGMNISTIAVASGASFADALSSSSLLAQTGSPLLLASTSSADNEELFGFTDSNEANISRVKIFGGTSTVASGTEETLRGILNNSSLLVSSLQVASTTDKVIVVSTASTTTSAAQVRYYEKNGWVWSEVINEEGTVGQNGIDKVREGDRKTPTGLFHFTMLMGIADDPGTIMPYTKITNSMYWCGGSNYYNQFIDESVQEHNCDKSNDEHLINYTDAYQYVAVLDFNSECVYGAGSAIFLHCKTGSYTAGCVGVSESNMKTLMQRIDSSTVIIIDTESNINGGKY